MWRPCSGVCAGWLCRICRRNCAGPLDDLLTNALSDDPGRYHPIRRDIERRVRAGQRHHWRSKRGGQSPEEIVGDLLAAPENRAIINAAGSTVLTVHVDLLYSEITVDCPGGETFIDGREVIRPFMQADAWFIDESNLPDWLKSAGKGSLELPESLERPGQTR